MVEPRERKSYNYKTLMTKKPYCYDCGGLPMLSTYIRKGAGGKKMFVVGYWCEWCSEFIKEQKWVQYQNGDDKNASTWSFKNKIAVAWQNRELFKKEMYHLRKEKLSSLKIELNEINEIDPSLYYSIANKIEIMSKLVYSYTPKGK